ncbi:MULTISPECIES: GspH/FimT family protein [Oceanisphaera]|uniref:Type II secretion system protein H n=1 Tax=Oceanisphaera ostreae TaxID=914151 RepID=A0ABW3KKT5_9GAMM
MKLSQEGLTLIELLVSVAVVAVLLSVAIPSFHRVSEQQKVRGAGMALYSDFQLARSEAIKRNKDVTVCFNGSGTALWSYHIKELAQPSDCDASVYLDINRVDNPASSTLILTASYPSPYVIFKPRRSSLVSGNVTFVDGGHSIKVITWNNSIIRTCSDSQLSGVPRC